MKQFCLLVLLLGFVYPLFSQDLREIYKNEDSASFENFLQLNELLYFANLENKVNKAVIGVTSAAAWDFLSEEKDTSGKKYYLFDQQVKVFQTKNLFEKECKSVSIKVSDDLGTFFGNTVFCKSNHIKPIILDRKIIDAINDTKGYSSEILIRRKAMLEKFFAPGSFQNSNLVYSYKVDKLILNKSLNQAILNIASANHGDRQIFYILEDNIWRKCRK